MESLYLPKARLQLAEQNTRAIQPLLLKIHLQRLGIHVFLFWYWSEIGSKAEKNRIAASELERSLAAPEQGQ